jgi:uroporphyrinogen decarboxylase
MPAIRPLLELLGEKPDPDFGRLRTVLGRYGEPDRVPLIELFADEPVMEAILGRPLHPPHLTGREAQTHYLDAVIEYYLQMGYDYVPVGGLMNFPKKENLSAPDTARLSHGQRHWYNAEVVTIATEEDEAGYAWPDPADIDLFPLRYVAEHLPAGMRIIGLGGGGVLENVMWLMGYEPLSFALVENPAFVERMFREVGSRLLGCFERVLEVAEVAACFMGDDLGFRTQTMVSPACLRELVFPWHRRMVEAVHRAGRFFLLHACGNLTEVMEDIIDVGFDGKHSFEDAIMPVSEAKKRWGDRIALLGGVDVDFLCRASEARIREYVRSVLRLCAPGGGYALGTGNSVANYIPVVNFLTMMEEGWRSGTYPIRC